MSNTNPSSPPQFTADEKRRRAITEWWKRQTLRDFITRIRAKDKS